MQVDLLAVEQTERVRRSGDVVAPTLARASLREPREFLFQHDTEAMYQRSILNIPASHCVDPFQGGGAYNGVADCTPWRVEIWRCQLNKQEHQTLKESFTP